MPTVLRIGAFRFFFYSADGTEPAHVHIERDDRVAKFWLSPIQLAANAGFRRKDLRDIERLVMENERLLLEAWNEHFGD